MSKLIRLATRGSRLALCQTKIVKEWFETHFPDIDVEIVKIATKGDTNVAWSLENRGGPGLFTREVEQAVLDGKADIAVHSAKDMPSQCTESTEIIGYLPREDARDVFIRKESVEAPAFIATSSPRRRIQGKRMYPTAVWKELRGNLETRLRKIENAHADATFLAAAGLNRLEINSWPELVFEPIAVDKMVPAAGQGAIALQSLKGQYKAYSEALDKDTYLALTLERAFLHRLGAGCQTAYAAHYTGQSLYLFAEGFEKPAQEAYTIENEADINSCLDAVFDKYHFKHLV